MIKCYMCGKPIIRRGYSMRNEKGEGVVICERCMRLWKKLKAEEYKAKGADDDNA